MSGKHLYFDLEHFFELSPDLICIAGFDGFFKKINPAVMKTLKYSEEELMAKPIEFFMHPDDRKKTVTSRDGIKNRVPLVNFENRYIRKDGEVVWLSWTSIAIEEQQIIFAIAKDITAKKKEKEYKVSSLTLKYLSIQNKIQVLEDLKKENQAEYSAADAAWLAKFETLVRKYAGKMELTLKMLSDEMAIGERQLFRRVKTITGVTPNQYIRFVRLQIALEAIQTGKYNTISEISYIAGFQTPAYFKKLFKEEYNLDIEDLL